MPEHIVFEGGITPPIHLEITCSECWNIYKYEIPLSTQVKELMIDQGWQPDKQICPRCHKS